MASISTPISTFSSSFSLLQKPRITNQGSPVLRLPSSKRGKVRCSIESKPAVTSDNSGQPSSEGKFIEGKTEWPELVGEKGDVAKAIIEKENPLVTVYVLHETDGLITPGSADFKPHRVRITVNTEDVVIRTPVIG